MSDHPLHRIVVLGNVGAGKSTLSRWLADLLDLPVVNLGPLCWRPGWEPVPNEESTKAILQALKAERWIIDGVSRHATRAADLIVFLDVPRRVAMMRMLRRNCRSLFRSRPEMPPRCPEIKMLATAIRLVWQFKTTVRPDLIHHCNEARKRGAEVRHLGGDRDVEELKRELLSRVGSTATAHINA